MKSILIEIFEFRSINVLAHHSLTFYRSYILQTYQHTVVKREVQLIPWAFLLFELLNVFGTKIENYNSITKMNLKSEQIKEEFTISIIDGVSIVKVNSVRATLNEARIFKQLIDSLISANHHKIIIDFSETLFLDSSIASVMIKVVKEIRKINGDIITVTPNGYINNIFIKTGLNKIFKQFDNTRNAVLSFSLA